VVPPDTPGLNAPPPGELKGVTRLGLMKIPRFELLKI